VCATAGCGGGCPVDAGDRCVGCGCWGRPRLRPSRGRVRRTALWSWGKRRRRGWPSGDRQLVLGDSGGSRVTAGIDVRRGSAAAAAAQSWWASGRKTERSEKKREGAGQREGGRRIKKSCARWVLNPLYCGLEVGAWWSALGPG
jgi:hypothetical protein